MSDAEARRELRELFGRWFAASSRKDIRGAMAPIDPEILSYEHEAPLQYRGIEAVRAVCQHGFDLAKGDFDWSIPDLEIVVSGDLAVAWGLNRMQFETVGGGQSVSWSRGTRVFRRRGGQWRMIHQHVSYPYDPETGQAKFDLAP